MKKTTNLNLESAAGLTLAVILGIGIGAIIGDIPIIKFKPEVEIGSLISLASLIAAIFIIPYIIDRSFAIRRHKSTLVLSEIDATITKLNDFMMSYRNKFYEGNPLTQPDIQVVTLESRSITNLLDGLTSHASNHSGLENMRSEIFDEFNLNTVADYTDGLRVGAPIEQPAVLKASKSTEEIISKLRNYRYQLRSE